MAEQSQRAPTLYAIIAIKLVKGIILLLLALGVYSLLDNDLSADYKQLLHWIHVDPERKFFAKLAMSIKQITPANIYWVATGTALYSLFSLVEGVGLIFRVTWAGWMAIGESLFFIPIEVYELAKHFSMAVLVILLLNIFIVIYLVRNRERLFHHHVPASPKPDPGFEI
jgi:uncharacterized membrane protein (DUF2068 family)